ncbi:MAG TPA: hypothetical protein VFN45_05625, partial [Myxococcaceae bacterium]|nr:hypothetical protein [Myxococcaceae bacterium]
MSTSHRRRVPEIVASDSTFEPFDLHDRPAWAGKCIHCNSRLVVLAEGNPGGSGHGGTPGSDLGRRHRRRGEPRAGLRRLQREGRRHDVRYGRTVLSVEVVTRLLQKRRPRLRPPPPHQ